MKIETIKTPQYKDSVLFYGADKRKTNINLVSEIDPKHQDFFAGFLNQKIKNSGEKKALPALSVYHPEMGIVMLVPVKSLEKPGAAQKTGGKIAKTYLKEKITAIEVIFPKSLKIPANIRQLLWMGIAKANYAVTKKKTGQKKPSRIETVHLCGTDAAGLEDIRVGTIVADSIYWARDMSNTPGNLFKPVDFKSGAQNIAKKYNLEFEAFDTAQIKKLGMGCFHAVAKGSTETAYLNALSYKYKKSAETIMLVGKGLTFDSGGYSLKPPSAMEEMKFDKCGGTTVLAAMSAIAQIKPAVNVVCLIPASENMISGKAMKPGDVYKACNGKTVEILNTDAEGRLILCDSLAYGIKKYKPAAVIDVATLTGACVVALGTYNAGLFSNDDDLAKQLIRSGENSGDSVWRMPMNEEFRKDLECTYADLKNVGSRTGGAITAAWFVREFVGDVPWAHLDIAGVSWNVKNIDYYPEKGASGYGVHLLVDFILNRANK